MIKYDSILGGLREQNNLGTSGNSGTSGSSGKDGNFFGSSGTSGIGENGSSGTSGIGENGSSGTSGIGENGSSGTSGISENGSSGTSGISENGSSGTSGISNHNNLSNLQGGDINEYYHLTLSEYKSLSGGTILTGNPNSLLKFETPTTLIGDDGISFDGEKLNILGDIFLSGKIIFISGITTINDNYLTNINDNYIRVIKNGITIILHEATGTGMDLTIKNMSNGYITVSRKLISTIDGQNSVNLQIYNTLKIKDGAINSWEIQ